MSKLPIPQNAWYQLKVCYGCQLHSTTRNIFAFSRIPDRFAEWSQACWQIQCEFLLGTQTKMDLRFVGLYHTDDVSFLQQNQDSLMGRAMSGWWDDCPEAGAKSRQNTAFGEEPPTLEVLGINQTDSTLVNLGDNLSIVFFLYKYILCICIFKTTRMHRPKLVVPLLVIFKNLSLRIPEAVREKFKGSFDDAMKKMTEKLDDETLVLAALKNCRGSSNTTTAGGTGNANRTAATPEWQGEYPWNFRKHMPSTGVPVADFETANTLLGLADQNHQKKRQKVFDTSKPSKNVIIKAHFRRPQDWCLCQFGKGIPGGNFHHIPEWDLVAEPN